MKQKFSASNLQNLIDKTRCLLYMKIGGNIRVRKLVQMSHSHYRKVCTNKTLPIFAEKEWNNKQL